MIVIPLAVIYLATGILFASWFLTVGIHKMDENAHGSTLAFRLFIMPGTVLLWPVLLRKYYLKNLPHD